MDKIFYNEASAAKLGWEPEWFGANDFDEDLIKKIRAFQKDIGTTVDGLCGPNTFRRIWTHREQKLSSYSPAVLQNQPKTNHIIYNNDFFPIDWPRVVLHFNHGGLVHTKGFKKVMKKRKPTMFVTHWDVCLSSESCFKVLTRRGLSIHFTIDNDGTIRQHLDMNHIASHAGSKVNAKSIGVEVSSAYYTRYQNWYVKNGFGERPVVEGAKVHGSTLKPFLGFYPVQEEALKALMKAVHECTGIPLKTPLDKSGETSYNVSRMAAAARFNGFVSHYHITKRKIDCANVDMKKFMDEIEESKSG